MRRLFSIIIYLTLPILLFGLLTSVKNSGRVSADSIEKKVYVTRKGDTLKRVGYLLTGDRSGWGALIQNPANSAVHSLKEKQPIPVGTQIFYEGPVIGESYVVKKGDWLVRIAEWKYGSYEEWERVYRTNRKNIARPDLIHPGDILTFSNDGSISRNGAALFEGGKTPMARRIPTSEGFGAYSAEEPFRVGFMVGMVLLGLVPFILYWLRRRDLDQIMNTVQSTPERSRVEPIASIRSVDEDLKPVEEPKPLGWPFRFKWKEPPTPEKPRTAEEQGQPSTLFGSGYHRIKRFRKRG